MPGCDCAERPESGGLWVAPEVVSGYAMMSSDVWSVGSLTYRLCWELVATAIAT